MILVIFAAFVVGGSAAFAVFFANPRSESFWQRFDEWWGFLWFWERWTCVAIAWGAIVGAALLVYRSRSSAVTQTKALLTGSLSGVFTCTAVANATHLFSLWPWLWLAVGAILGVASTLALLSWLRSPASAGNTDAPL